ncbi:MAG: hypothetical protein ACREAA_18500 [Candidatus Polarisedimenticolia bacterium]
MSPVVLRGLLFAGCIEALFYRLAPLPDAVRAGWEQRLLISLHRGGALMFFAAYLLVVVSLVSLSSRTWRQGRWPGWLNTFLSLGFLGLAALGVAAVGGARSEAFVLIFTALSLVIVLAICMHGFTTGWSASARAFTVAYGAAALCSSAHLAWQTAGTSTAWLRSPLFEQALPAGQTLLAAAAVCAFLAFHDAGAPGAWSGAGPAALAAAAVAASTLFGSGHLALDGDAHPARVTLMAGTVFLAGLTGASCLRDPLRRQTGMGLLLLVLAGFPLRIAHQQMLMVVGAALLMAPALVPRPVFLPLLIQPEASPTPDTPPS